MAKMLNLRPYKLVHANVQLTLDVGRFSSQFAKAQFQLDSMVMTHMQPYMPMVTGTFINETKAISASMAGTGWVCAGAGPMGRFLYEGKVMVDPVTRSPFARFGAKKVVTNRPLTYSGQGLTAKGKPNGPHPKATDHWFEAAKAVYGDKWIKTTKRVAGGRR